jgi:hypothetical protein
LHQISSKYYGKARHLLWSRGRIILRRLGFNHKRRGLVKMYQVKLKRGRVVTVYEDEMKRDSSRI